MARRTATAPKKTATEPMPNAATTGVEFNLIPQADVVIMTESDSVIMIRVNPAAMNSGNFASWVRGLAQYGISVTEFDNSMSVDTRMFYVRNDLMDYLDRLAKSMQLKTLVSDPQMFADYDDEDEE